MIFAFLVWPDYNFCGVIIDMPFIYEPYKKCFVSDTGFEGPALGLGTYSLTGRICESSVYSALEHGIRYFDSAYFYHNEREVGASVRRGIDELGIDRSDIVVQTKLYPNQFSDARRAVEEAFEKLGLDYIDIMLLHHPGPDDVAAYRELESYVRGGHIRALGLSNWYIRELPVFLRSVDIKPVLVQNEIHPYYQETDVVPFIQEQGIVMQSWYPLGGRGYNRQLFGDPVLERIARRLGVSVPQVILRWAHQRGIALIPGTSVSEHMHENLAIFGFELTKDDMCSIASINRNEKHDWY